MNTIVIEKNEKAKRFAVDILSKGGIIAFKADTIYGLCCDARNDEAIKRIYEIKQRDDDRPLLSLVRKSFPIEKYTTLNRARINKLKEIWPAPLTVILEKNEEDYFSSQLIKDGCFSIRIPNDKFALGILKKYGSPITSTSANISGQPVCSTVKELESTFGGKIDLIIDCGEVTKESLPSTLIKVDRKSFTVVRPGVIKKETISSIL